jgi:hypothetical protein
MSVPATIRSRSKTPWLVFTGAFAVTLLFALVTQHVWEDFYITYRSSKNFATGQGLVFNPGEHLHTFTSPLGVLLPSLASLLTLNSSDLGALWIFRLVSCAAFGGAAAILFSILKPRPESASHLAALPAVLAVLWLILDAKSVDFSINGMETAFMLLFLALALRTLFNTDCRRWVVLGLSWAGLMWTRPDSFIYVGLMGGGVWLFNNQVRTGLDRRGWLPIFIRAGLLCSILYIPWLLVAWAYYGSPIPFTIIAKGTAAGGGKTLLGVLITARDLLFHGSGSLPIAFLPSYSEFGGWPEWPWFLFRNLGRICAFLWILPFVRAESRVASFVFMGSQIYLSYFPNYPYPWYLPASFFFAVMAIGAAFAQAYEGLHSSRNAWRHFIQTTILIAALGAVAIGGWYLLASAQQLREQQRLIETGTRKQIGEWLKTNASPRDTVFLEPLGYVGFFSGLKIYDYPGLSSIEVVSARRKLGEDWGALIRELKPEWVILRPKEIARIQKTRPDLLESSYAPVRNFSVLDQVRSLDIRGRAYLEHDAVFTVFRRK